MALAEVLAIKHATVERRIVLTRHRVNHGCVDASRNRFELLHPLRMNVARVGIVGQVAGENHEVRSLRHAVQHRDRIFEGRRSQWIGWALKAHVRIAELRERKTPG